MWGGSTDWFGTTFSCSSRAGRQRYRSMLMFGQLIDFLHNNRNPQQQQQLCPPAEHLEQTRTKAMFFQAIACLCISVSTVINWTFPQSSSGSLNITKKTMNNNRPVNNSITCRSSCRNACLQGPTLLVALTVGGSVEAKSFVLAASGGPESADREGSSKRSSEIQSGVEVKSRTLLQSVKCRTPTEVLEQRWIYGAQL